MKRSDDSEREKRRKRRRLIQELGEQRIPYLSPADPGFQELWDSSYAGLALRQSSALPDGLHERVQSALITLQRRGCLLRDLVRVRDRDVFTAVSRALVGQPGYTYRYLDTRLFTIPWHCEGEEGQKDEKEKPCCDSDLRDDRLLEEKQEKEKKEEEEEDIQFNITIINYMDPSAMTQLKEEPYYGMGKMAVGWHHDEDLVPLSPVAVYSYSCPAEPKKEGERSNVLGTAYNIACWRVGLKVAWDIHTPGLALPLQSGDCYYMTADLNRTHQHCVLAGETARFSSTHRVVQCCTGTLDYIKKRCSEALENLHTDPEKNTKSLKSLLPSALQRIEDIHNEVFEWLRQYWFQGRRYARFCSWWTKPMEQMEKDWKEMERMTQLLLDVVEDENTAQENRREMADVLLNALTDRQQHRQTWRDRYVCQSSLAQTLPAEEAPADRPYWSNEDPDMPLPFDLSEIINRVESLLWRGKVSRNKMTLWGCMTSLTGVICVPLPFTWRIV
uniref:Alpha-ketoglutarate-dependent dioxygenase FTO n=1 Tax=Cyprinus carpio TaxID=7962 RepID=A0A8C1KL23_CYPCA